VIHALNRAAITNLDELRQVLAKLKPGDAAVLQIERQGAFMYLPFEFE
jgi:S1-C subfamily serine protease